MWLTFLVAVLFISRAECLPKRDIKDLQQCSPGSLAHSNRNSTNMCQGALGDECAFTCDVGYVPTGRHICTDYQSAGRTFVNYSFFGGKCERLCRTVVGAQPQAACSGAAKIRFNSSDGEGQCFRTMCFNSSDDALRNVARGNYEVWRQLYHPSTGQYLDNLDLVFGGGPGALAASGVTGLGIIFECVAAAMGWQTVAEAGNRVHLSLTSLAGHTPGFNIPRNPRGFWSHFYDPNTGATQDDDGCMMCSGLLMGGVLFAKEFFNDVAPTSHTTEVIAELALSLYNTTRFEQLLCSDGPNSTVNSNGTAIPMIQGGHDDSCSALMTLDPDGMYNFNEEHYTVWLGYEQGCANQSDSQCSRHALENMWDRWQSRRYHPNEFFNSSAGQSFPLLSVWSGYIVQLPFYTTHSFNSDPTYRQLFKSHWQADWAFYNQSALAAGYRGRYGLGAGPTPAWCAEGSSYDADRIDGTSSSHCVVYSPYITAGYMPVAPDLISQQLLELLEDGDAVLPVKLHNSSRMDANEGSMSFVLWRKSLLDANWTQGYGLTAVDFSSELFGLSTLWLGEHFYQKYTNHFPF